MKKIKKALAILLVMIVSFSVVSVGAEAVSVSLTNSDYGYMLPANYNFTKTVSTVYLNGSYDYINFYINSEYSETYFFYEIYSDKNCTKLVTGDYTYCSDYGTYKYTPYIKLLGTFSTGTYYCVTYAADIDEYENVKVSKSSMVSFKIVVNRNPSYSQNTVGLKSVTNTVDGPKVSWYKLNNSTVKYNIYRRYLTGNKWVKVGTVNGSTYTFTDKSVKNKNGRYVYTVRGVDKNGTLTKYHYSGVAAHYAAAPVVSSVSTVVDNRIQVKWNDVGSGAKYYIYRKENNGGWVLLKSNYNGTVFYDTTAKSGNNYRYTVRAFIYTGTGNAFSSFYNGKAVDYVDAPKMTAVNKVDNGIKLDWNAAKGATGYTVYRRKFASGDNWKEIARFKNDVFTFIDEKAEQGVSYTYTVRAEGVGVRGSYLSAGINYVLLDAPVISSSELSYNNSLDIKWGSVSNATSYEAYVQKESGEWELIGKVNANTYSKQYSVNYTPDRAGVINIRVRAGYKNQSYSEFSDVYTVNYYPEISGLMSEIRVAGNYLRWDSDSRIDKYNIYRVEVSESGENIGEYEFLTAIETSEKDVKLEYTDTTVESDKTYKYAIKRVFDGVEHDGSKERTFARLPITAVDRNEEIAFISDRNGNKYLREVDIIGLDTDYDYDIFVYNYETNTWEDAYFTEENGFIYMLDYDLDDVKPGSNGEYSFSIVYFADGKSTPIDAITYTGKFVNFSYGEVKTQIEYKGVRVTWNPVKGAQKYVLTYLDENTGTKKVTEVVADNSQLYSTVLDVDVYAKYGVNLLVYIDAYMGDMQYGRHVFRVYAEESPKLYKAVSEKEGAITVYWDHSDYGYYKMYRKAEGETTWTCISTNAYSGVKTVDGKSRMYYIDTTVQEGVTYTYTVRKSNIGGGKNCFDSFHDIEGVSAISLSMPTINSATNTTKGVNLGWNKVKGAEGYYVYRKTPSSNWVLIGKVADGATVSYLDTTAKSGTEYYYTVRAYSGSTLSSYKGKYVKYK